MFESQIYDWQDYQMCRLKILKTNIIFYCFGEISPTFDWTCCQHLMIQLTSSQKNRPWTTLSCWGGSGYWVVSVEKGGIEGGFNCFFMCFRFYKVPLMTHSLKWVFLFFFWWIHDASFRGLLRLRRYGECMRKSWGVETSRLGKIVSTTLVWGA